MKNMIFILCLVGMIFCCASFFVGMMDNIFERESWQVVINGNKVEVSDMKPPLSGADGYIFVLLSGIIIGSIFLGKETKIPEKQKITSMSDNDNLITE